MWVTKLVLFILYKCFLFTSFSSTLLISPFVLLYIKLWTLPWWAGKVVHCSLAPSGAAGRPRKRMMMEPLRTTPRGGVGLPTGLPNKSQAPLPPNMRGVTCLFVQSRYSGIVSKKKKEGTVVSLTRRILHLESGNHIWLHAQYFKRPRLLHFNQHA